MKRGTSGRAAVTVRVPPEDAYDFVADVTNLPRWSPECRECEWLDSASTATVGARFRGRNKRGLIRWTTKPSVVVADRGREFSFVVDHGGRPLTRWTYRFSHEGDGTQVTESFEILDDIPWYIRLSERLLMRVPDRHADLDANLRTTLSALRAELDGHRAGERRSNTGTTSS